jgi:hypothetical protein
VVLVTIRFTVVLVLRKLSGEAGDDVIYGGADTDPFTHGGELVTTTLMAAQVVTYSSVTTGTT